MNERYTSRQDAVALPEEPPVRIQRPRVALIWTNYGPYHLARARALRDVADVIPIELAAHENLYGWHLEDKETEWLVRISDKAWEHESKWIVAGRLWRALDGLNPDVVFVPGYATIPAISAAVWGRFRGKATFLMSDSNECDFRRDRSREALKAFLIKRLFDAAIVAGTRAAAYAERLGIHRTCIVQGYDVVDNEAFATQTECIRRTAEPGRYGLPAEYFLFVGRLAEVKNVPTLLHAYEAYREQGGTWSMVLVGQGPLRDRLQGIALRSSFAKDIHFIGFKNGAAIMPYYAFAGCFVLPSNREPWGLVVNEAMASGLAVIVSRACGCADDLVFDGINGYLFTGSEQQELTKLMLRMSRFSRSERLAMGRRSSDIVARYSLQTWSKSVGHLLCELSR